MARSFLEKVFDAAVDEYLVHALESKRLSADELDQLEAMLAEARHAETLSERKSRSSPSRTTARRPKMSHAIETYTEWLADYYLLSTVLLALTLLVVAVLKQPAQRLAVTKSRLVALILLALLSHSRWSAVHLLTAERTKPTADLPQSVSAAPDVTSTQSPRVEIDPTSLNGANSLPSLPQGEGRMRVPIGRVSWPTIFATVHLSGALASSPGSSSVGKPPRPSAAPPSPLRHTFPHSCTNSMKQATNRQIACNSSLTAASTSQSPSAFATPRSSFLIRW